MRILPTDEQRERKEKILQAVVHTFIKTGKPVGSNTILDHYHLNLSSATIRNVLADLESEGYLTHPHTSAGRMPTDKGYRFYVDSIVNIQRLAVEEERRIREEYSNRMRQIEDLMRSTTRLLSSLTQCTSFALPPLVNAEKLRRIELISVGPNQILAVFVSETGFVKNQMIHMDHAPSDETLRSASRFLNERLVGLGFNDVQGHLLAELDRYQTREILNREFLQHVSKVLFDSAPRENLYVEGASNIFNFPEFQDYQSMRNFAQIVDEKKLLAELLAKELTKQGLQVRIGSESSPELKDFSVVSSSYHMNGRPVGVVGILGPKRMEYQRMMSIVNAVAKLVNQVFENDKSPLLEEFRNHD